MSAYFSFFGAVETPEVRDPELARIADHGVGFRYGNISPLHLRWMRGAVEYLGDGTRAVAIPRGDQALLFVWAYGADWCDCAVVAWPIQFVAPAAIAGACCAPRYGLV